MFVSRKALRISMVVSILFAITMGIIASATDLRPVSADPTLQQGTIPLDPAPEPSQEELEAQRYEAERYQEEDAQIAAQYFHCEDDIQYYAYLDYETAEEALQPVILAARNRIIYRYSWVADGTSGRILGKDGNVKQELPQFSDIFPEDWDLPTHPASAVDLSYYAISGE